VSLQLETHSPGSSRRLFATALGVFIANYGLLISSNIPALAGKPPFSPAGNLPENGEREYNYAKSACPKSDASFARAVLPSISLFVCPWRPRS
jgi:hypothetical protein